jgi:hypothetical protein
MYTNILKKRKLRPSSSGLKTNLNLHHSNTYNHTYRTISWLSCKPITAEAQVQIQASPCGICGGQIGSEKDISLGVFQFSPLRITLLLLDTDSSVTDTIQSSHLLVSLNNNMLQKCYISHSSVCFGMSHSAA